MGCFYVIVVMFGGLLVGAIALVLSFHIWTEDSPFKTKFFIVAFWIVYGIAIATCSVFFALESLKVDKRIKYKEYTTELYAFTDNTQQSIQGNSSYFLFIGGGNISTTSEYKITYLAKAQDGRYQRKTLSVNEEYDEIKIYYDIQDDNNVTPKLITRTEGRSESYKNFWRGMTEPEKIVSYTFVIPKDSIGYDNIINS